MFCATKESFIIPKWGILTHGQEPHGHYDTDDGF